MISNPVEKIYLAILNQWEWWWEVSSKKDELARAILTISIVTLVAFWYQWTCSKSKNGTSSLPPGPYGLPILGYLPFLGTNLHKKFTDLAHRYGPIYKLRLGTKLYVVVNSPTLAKAVVRDQDMFFANRDPPIAALTITYGGTDIVWSNNNSYWRNMRKVLVREVLSNRNLEASQGFRREEVRKTIKNVCTKIGTRVDINEISFLTELNVIMSMLWGSTLGDRDSKTINLEAKFRKVISKMVELLGKPNVSDFIPMLAWFDLQSVEREAKQQVECVEEIFNAIIEERIKFISTKSEEAMEKHGRKDFLQILLEIKEHGDSTATRINHRQIKAILLDIVVGATDTTATMAEWVMAEIIRNPGVMEKFQDELSQVVGLDNIVEESHLPNLHYFDAVVKETFRLHPPVPLLTPRCPNQSCIVGGYTVPKGTRVFLNVWAIQRDPQNWDNPTEFKPERFLNDAMEKCDFAGNNLRYLPFGSGRRTCPGIPLAEKMLMYILASLLHSFEWSLPKGEELDLSEEFGIVMKKRRPLIAIPSQRLPNANSLYS